MRRSWVTVALLALAGGCGSGYGPRDVVVTRHIDEGGGAPELSRVSDMGDLDALPARGPLPALRSDGVFTVGELILIEGDDIGKQPAVKVDGRPSRILARIGNGGIICRIPPGVQTGTVEVVVETPAGGDTLRIDVHRHAVVVDGDRGLAHVVDVGKDGEAVIAASFEVPGARDVAFSADGQVAYVAADSKKPSLAVLSMAAAGGPKLARSIEVPTDRALGVVSAADSELVAVVGGNAVAFFDGRDAPFPRLLSQVVLPNGARAVALTPDGGYAAVLASEKNTVAIINLRRPSAPRIDDEIELIAGETVPLTRALAFSPTGDELWVLSGDSRESAVAGSRPTTIVSVKPDPVRFAVDRQVEIAAAGAPLSLAVGSRETIGAATAIRSNRRRGAIIVAAANRALVQPDPGLSLAGISELGQLLRVDLEGNATVLHGGSSLIRDATISHDLNLVIVASTVVNANDPTKADFGVGAVPFEGGRPTFLKLDSADTSRLHAPAAVAIAP